MNPPDKLGGALRTLANPYRRQLLIALSRENQQGESLDPLKSITGEPVTDDVETALAHNHIPMLEDHGYVTWDQDSNTIKRGPDWDEVATLIELLYDHRDDLPGNWQ